MGGQRVAKITISLPKALLDFADCLARERATSRSEVIASLMEKEEETKVQTIDQSRLGHVASYLSGDRMREVNLALHLSLRLEE